MLSLSSKAHTRILHQCCRQENPWNMATRCLTTELHQRPSRSERKPGRPSSLTPSLLPSHRPDRRRPEVVYTKPSSSNDGPAWINRRSERPPLSEGRTSRPYALVDRPDVTAGHARPSQRPFGVAQEITRIFAEGTLDEAIIMVTSAPISSQNEVVWTLLIKQALKENRANLAFDLYNKVSFRNALNPQYDLTSFDPLTR